MNLYLQYHNVANEGLLLSDPPFSASRLAIHTRCPNVRKADGRVFLIVGIGRPRRFFLWESFQIEAVKKRSTASSPTTTQRAAVRTPHYQPVRALSIRQPHAEAIIRQ